MASLCATMLRRFWLEFPGNIIYFLIINGISDIPMLVVLENEHESFNKRVSRNDQHTTIRITCRKEQQVFTVLNLNIFIHSKTYLNR